jgi:DNA-binding FadR family transcriptional regulator
METNYTDLAGIVGAIEGGRSEEASQATKTHITRFKNTVR